MRQSPKHNEETTASQDEQQSRHEIVNKDFSRTHSMADSCSLPRAVTNLCEAGNLEILRPKNNVGARRNRLGAPHRNTGLGQIECPALMEETLSAS